jgi:hypothetical protein
MNAHKDAAEGEQDRQPSAMIDHFRDTWPKPHTDEEAVARNKASVKVDSPPSAGSERVGASGNSPGGVSHAGPQAQKNWRPVNHKKRSWYPAFKIFSLIVVTIISVGTLLFLALYLEPLGLGPPEPPPPPPTPAYLDLEAVYQEHAECLDNCRSLRRTASLEVALPSPKPKDLAEKISGALEKSDWREAPGGAPDRLAYEKQLSSVTLPSPPWWRLRVTGKIPLPDELFLAPLGIASYPPGEVEWPVDRPYRASINGVKARIVPANTSTLYLSYPRFAISATTPSSEGPTKDRADGRQERLLTLSHQNLEDNHLVAVDIVAIWARSQVGEKLAVFTLPAAIATALTALAALAITPIRTRLFGVIQRIGRRYRRVLVRQSGEVYHMAGCERIAGEGNLQKITLARAKRERKKPCGICVKPLK